MAAEKTIPVELSDGTKAQLRRPKGRDLINAQNMAGDTGNKMKFTCALLAQVTTLNGKQCVPEDIQELYASDIDKLAEVVGKGFLPSTDDPSPSSSSGSSSSLN